MSATAAADFDGFSAPSVRIAQPRLSDMFVELDTRQKGRVDGLPQRAALPIGGGRPRVCSGSVGQESETNPGELHPASAGSARGRSERRWTRCVDLVGARFCRREQPAVLGCASTRAVEEACDCGGLSTLRPKDRPLRHDAWVGDLAGDDSRFGRGGVQGERCRGQVDLAARW